MRFFRARSLILSPSNKSIARHVLPLKPALKSLSGSGRLAPWEKVSFTLSLWALPTAIIPSRDHTGLPIHFHSSMISRSASRMLLRMLANVLPRQSVSFAISWSIRSDGFIGSLCLEFLSRFHAHSLHLHRELPGVLRVQSLPAAELHGLGADDSSNGLTGEKPIQHIEADVPARSAHRYESTVDVVPKREPSAAASQRLQFPAHVLSPRAEFENLGRVGPLHLGLGYLRRSHPRELCWPNCTEVPVRVERSPFA